jgi:transposase
MDMWKPFRNSAARHIPNAAILFDKFQGQLGLEWVNLEDS